MGIGFRDSAAGGVGNIGAEDDVVEGEGGGWAVGEVGDCEGGGSAAVFVEKDCTKALLVSCSKLGWESRAY